MTLTEALDCHGSKSVTGIIGRLKVSALPTAMISRSDPRQQRSHARGVVLAVGAAAQRMWLWTLCPLRRFQQPAMFSRQLVAISGVVSQQDLASRLGLGHLTATRSHLRLRPVRRYHPRSLWHSQGCSGSRHFRRRCCVQAITRMRHLRSPCFVLECVDQARFDALTLMPALRAAGASTLWSDGRRHAHAPDSFGLRFTIGFFFLAFHDIPAANAFSVSSFQAQVGA